MNKILKKTVLSVIIAGTILGTSGVATVPAASCTATNHVGFHWIYTRQPSCVTQGEKVYACACGKLRNTPTPVPALGHNWVQRKPEYYYCTRCTAMKPA